MPEAPDASPAVPASTVPLLGTPWVGRGSPGRALVLTGLAMVATVVLLALAPTPHDPRAQIDPGNSLFRPPGTSLIEIRLADGDVLLADRVTAGAEGQLTVFRRRGDDNIAAAEVLNLPPPEAPGDWDRRLFLLGTDHLGRDVLSRLISGARVSLKIGLLAVGLALSLGLFVGLVAAMAGGWVDALLMRIVDALLSVPQLFLIVTLATVFEPSQRMVILFLGGTLWMPISRLVRAEVLSVQERDFVLAARGLGVSRLRLALGHLLPNALTPVLVQATLAVGAVILAEAALAYLSIGIEPGTPTWGQMIDDGGNNLDLGWWMTAFPGFAIAWTVIAFNLLGDGLREWLDPAALSSR